jgi:hypothetical protein
MHTRLRAVLEARATDVLLGEMRQAGEHFVAEFDGGTFAEALDGANLIGNLVSIESVREVADVWETA